MPEENQRKASEILLTLEAKVDIMAKHIQNIDNNIKLILNKLVLNQALMQSGSANTVKFEPVINQIVEPINQRNSLEKQKIEDVEKDFDFTQVDINTKPSGKKVAVQQRVTYSDGKNICLANVKIKNSNGEIVKETRTNAMGKWIAVLEAGNYTVNVSKSANKTNAEVELSLPINIQESDRPIELPIAKV